MFTRSVAADERRVARLPIEGAHATLRTPGDVRILDVGVYGLAIEAPTGLEIGGHYFLELRHGRHTANVEVTVRWLVRRGSNGHATVHAGVQFAEIYRDDAGGIWDWLMVPSATTSDEAAPH